MATFDLRDIAGNEFVLHFGGRTNEVDACTFAKSILAFSEALHEINTQLIPNFEIEIAIDAVGSGSFRARLKTGSKKSGGLLGDSLREILVAILATFICTKIFPPEIKVVVNDDSYVIEQGHDRIILPKSVYDAKKMLSRPEDVDKHVSKAFEVLKEDNSITDFGITKNLDDKKPMISIPRADFDRLAEPVLSSQDKKRSIDKETKLVVIKAVLERSERKWQFVWQGIKISAPIKDATFFDRLAKHEYEFGQGDILDVVLRIHQIQDDISGAYLNESYEVMQVITHTSGPKQIELIP